MKKILTTREMAQDKSHPEVEWRPASTLDQIDGLDEENFRYRWVEIRTPRVKKMMAEGWSFVNEMDGDRVFHKRAQTGALDAGKPLDSMAEYKDVVLMKLPMATAIARRHYYQKKTDKAAELINREAQEEARTRGGNVKPHVRITTGNQVTVID
jgi:hypothetical protein